MLGKLFGRKKAGRKVIMLGLDGTPYSLIKDLAERGVMPATAALVGDEHFAAAGRLMQMDSSIPEISSVAWTSTMTGRNPAKHGIFGFTDLKPGTYDLVFPNFANVQTNVLWDVLGAAGKRSVIVNQPSTYPARKLSGVLIAGFVAIDLKKAVYPPELVPRLEAMGYRIDVDAARTRDDMDAFIEDLFATLRVRERAILELFDEGGWDFFMGVVTGTDRLHHFLWDAYENEAHPRHEVFLDYYRAVDGLIGKITDRIEAGAPLVMMSDHGFTRIKKEVFLNRWLCENGYLDFAADPPESLSQIADGSRAFCLDPSRIYINVKGHYPKGCVEPADVPALLDELAAKLAALADPETGEPMIRNVYRRDEVFSGPLLRQAPCLVLVSNWGWDLKGSVKRHVLAEKGTLTGMHTQDDAFLYIRGAEVTATAKPTVRDVMPTILQLAGCKAPADLDGHSLIG
ncbi:MAG: alkaline phosphatase family protein [Verrucomicrobia bacterium]|nr:alkaline phosphatase family protein [Verrucomicrobiota bacterium]